MQPFLMQQRRDLFIAEMGQKRFAGTRGVHRQLAANRRGHAHQLGTLHLIDDHRLMIAEIQHRQIDRFARGVHQAAQHRMHQRQQIATLQEAAAHHKGMCSDGPQPQIAHLADKALLLHGAEQTMSGGVRQTCLLCQFGQRHAAVGIGNQLQQCQAASQGLHLAARGCGSGGSAARFFAALNGNRRRHDQISLGMWKSFSF